ncbi:MAG TPA: DUF2333 family protein [Patescibacteria group bacterium]|nr:DUF2333 family protein [Patescibacteria group bacterium]
MEPLPPVTPVANDTPVVAPRRRRFWRFLLAALALLAGVCALLMWRWSTPPTAFDPLVQAKARNGGGTLVVGIATTATLARVGELLLDKHGGYLSNDVTPPSLFLDDMPNWEFGVIEQSRDLAMALRRDFSRSMTQSIEDKDLAEAQPLFSTTNDRWLLPSTESQYRAAIARIDAYRVRLGDGDMNDAQFYARADNLTNYLAMVESRLGSLSQRLSAAVGPTREDTDLANDPNARQSKPGDVPREVRTPWREIDDVFYEARGSCFALVHFLKAIEHDYAVVLKDKNASVTLRQIIAELEATQEPLGSPIILNGSPYGFFANHSLVMANYIARANASIIELRRLLERG